MKIVIIGGGSIGLSLFYHIKKIGVHPVFCLRRKHDFECFNISCKSYKDKFDLSGEDLDDFEYFDLIINTVKSYDLKNSLNQYFDLYDKSKMALFIQNGLGIDEIIESVFPYLNYERGLITFGANLKDNNLNFFSGKLILSSRFYKILNFINSDEISIVSSADIKKEIVNKFITNCVINPLTVLFQCKNNMILSKELDLLRKRLFNEVVIFVNKLGLEFSITLEEIEHIANSGNVSSMLQDYLANKKLELDYLNGYIIKNAENFSIDISLNNLICCLILDRLKKMRF
ncbi:MAG: 2-dehydropantoate 2-reductase [Candidatus Delongbacteria bacterium]|nr:2-dehydropantoate 2-reductase [Candidatus Delongbacteria bacterium]MBN2834035.1 2-dehydropantoate 2-reductase [Candidatus Delongbacteria bacterium]